MNGSSSGEWEKDILTERKARVWAQRDRGHGALEGDQAEWDSFLSVKGNEELRGLSWKQGEECQWENSVETGKCEDPFSSSEIDCPRWQSLGKKASQALGFDSSSTTGPLSNAMHMTLTLWSSVSLFVNWVLWLLWGPNGVKHGMAKMLAHI